jgi:hypothetical protein
MKNFLKTLQEWASWEPQGAPHGRAFQVLGLAWWSGLVDVCRPFHTLPVCQTGENSGPFGKYCQIHFALSRAASCSIRT